MSALSIAALAVGLSIVAVNAPAAAKPAAFIRFARAFPRSKTAAWILTGIDLIWVAWIVNHASLDRFDALKPFLWIATPLAFAAVVVFMDELLAPRALGGLLLLAANPILNAARWNPSDWRLVMTVIAYIWIVGGILLVLGPYRLRLWAERMIANERRCRMFGAARLLVGLVLVALAFTVYR